ncbi:hypothetical protein B0I35DRAFT_434634 [Stachybotrys elegans]|uniref:Uncharacterized protein n=1 Tax=Stachybotrys elegans TaxID=80388 RepID=A0A8K0SQW0_9HYPO|nr:hypothetical protein B0I35DRAFT_434634 [Stachybotrys elegans]
MRNRHATARPVDRGNRPPPNLLTPRKRAETAAQQTPSQETQRSGLSLSDDSNPSASQESAVLPKINHAANHPNCPIQHSSRGGIPSR